MDNKKFLWIIPMAIIIIFVASAFTGFDFNTLTGISTMSISSANYVEGGEIKEGFLFDVIVNGGGESISMVVDPKDIERTGLNVLPEVFKVEMELVNPVCTYRIEDTDDTIYRLYQATVRHSFVGGRCGRSSYGLDKPVPYNLINLNTVKAACRDQWNPPTNLHNPEYCGKTYAPLGTGVESPGSDLPKSANCNSLVEIQDKSQGASLGADVGEWGYMMPRSIAKGWDDDHWEVTHIAGEPFYNVQRIGTKAFLDYEVKVTVKNNEGVVTSALLNNRDKVADLGSYGRVKLVGNLLADEFCENPAINYDIIENKGVMKFADRDEVNRYTFALKNLAGFDNNYYQYKQTDPGVGRDVLWYLMSSANGALNDLYKDNPSPIGCTIKGNQVVCEPETQVAYPNIQMLLESTYVGISEDRRQEINNLIADLESDLDNLNVEQKAELEALRSLLNSVTDENRAEVESQIAALSSIIDYKTQKQLEEILQLKLELQQTNLDLMPLINIPTNGIPKILKAKIIQSELFDREIGDLEVTVMNIGTDDDSFDIDLRCGVDEISFGSKRISLKSLEEETIKIKVNGDTGRYSCEVVATSTNQAENQDRKSITIVFKEKEVIKEPAFFEGKYGTMEWMYIIMGILIITVIGLVIYVKKRK